MTMDAIAAALLDATGAMPELVKGSLNQHQGYSYVPIDDYYRVIPKIAQAHGLTWRMREVAWSRVDVGKSGALAFTYQFDLIHKSGAVAVDFAAFTIVHPVQGAQTSGSAASYADKLFMRTTFKLVTGEQDADATDSSAFSRIEDRPPDPADNPFELREPTASPQADEAFDNPHHGHSDDAEILTEDYARVGSHANDLMQPVLDVEKLSDGDAEKLRIVERIFEVWLPAMADMTSLYRFHEDNLVPLEMVQKLDPAMRQRIRNMFNAQRDHLKGA